MLRKIRLTDYFNFHKWYCLAEVSRFSRETGANSKISAVIFVLRAVYNYYFKRRKNYYYWAVVKDKRMIGFVGLNETNVKDRFSIYYMLSPDYQRSGYTKEAVNAVLEYMKTQSCELLIGACDSENIASYRVLSDCGFQWRKRRENYYPYSDGRCGNSEVFVYRFRPKNNN